jgi:chromosome segregation ATPase
MSLTIEVELKDIITKIDQRLERMEQGQNELKLSVSELKGDVNALAEKLSGDIKNIDEKLGGKINTLDTKVDGLSTRIGNQEILLRTIVGGLILIIVGGAAKMFLNFPVNP